jgi:hypothetical protein
MYRLTLLKRSLALTFSGILLFTLQSFAQIVTITGVVTDSNSKQAIPGVSVTIGKYSTSTDAAGKYVIVVQKLIVEQQAISFTSVGYKPFKRNFVQGDADVVLIPSSTLLEQVVIATKAESIIHKAIRKIPENYMFDEFAIKGRVRIINSAKNDQQDVYFYKSEASLRVYFPPYAKKATPDIALLAKKDTLITDPEQETNVRFVGGYTAIANKDYVRVRPEFLKANTKKYSYVVNGKDWVKNKRVYVVNFYSTQTPGNAGTLYIDTATYAFVRVAYTSYNIKRAFMLKIDKSTNVIDYKFSNGQWFLEATETSIVAFHNYFDLYKTINFKSDAVQTTAVEPIEYQDRLPDGMEDVNIGKSSGPMLTAENKEASDEQSSSVSEEAVTSIFENASSPVSKNSFSPVSSPSIDTGLRTKQTFIGRLNLLKRFRNYLLGDNVREAVGLVRIPLEIRSNQMLSGKTISPISTYALQFNAQLRIINETELFVHLEDAFNFGIGGIKNAESAYSLAYNFKLNRTGHPLLLSPLFGISTIELSKKKVTHYHQRSLFYGINFSYEVSPRLAWYVSGKYYDVYRTRNTALIVSQHPLSVGAGLIFKIKR